MRRYRLVLSLFVAVCTVCTAVLLTRISFLPYLLMFPGGMVLAGLGMGGWLVPNPVLLMLANVGVYTLSSSLCLLLGFSELPELKLRRLNLLFGSIATVLAVLALIPSINPIWPQGMKALKLQEAELRKSLPNGVSIEKAASILNSRGIKFDMNTASERFQVMSNRNGVTWADAGDRVIYSRFRTGAEEYCGYDMAIVLIFGADGLAKHTYVSRDPICP